ncbi:MAG: DUF58 domain-containing protein [Deltaproteobacteria bacterium]|nr:DUF58 domain-containing protein [Deltaproteobacteria bacterium]
MAARLVARRFARWVVGLRRYFPLTNLGVAIATAATLAIWLFALPRIDYVVELVAMLALVLVGLAFLVVVPAAIWVHRAFAAQRKADRAPVIIEAHRGFAILLRMPALRVLPVVEVSWSWLDPSGFKVELHRDGGVIVERVEALERAEVEEVTRRFVVEDAFGLARITLDRKERRPIRVLPFTGKLGSAPMLRSHAGGDELSHPTGVPEGDRVDMRHYVPGDPLRLALWKVYARTGELMVRNPERAISPSWRIVAYLVAAEGDEPAAAAARVALHAGLFGEGWRFAADGSATIAEEPESALGLVVGSRRARGTPAGDGAGLRPFLDRVGESARTRLILFLPARSGPWLERVTGAIRDWSGAVTAIVATDRVRDLDAGRSRLDRILRLPAPPDPSVSAETTVAELETVVSGLARAGAYVVAVERPTGRLIASPAQSGARRVA